MTSPLPRERILVVDEDWDILDLITKQVLEPLGYSTASARDAERAIQHALSYEPDLIIASLTLPGLSGKDLIVALRSRGIEAPVLITAKEGMDADAIQAFRLGACNYLVKPLREAELAAAVDHALNENRLRVERQELADKLASSNRQLEERVHELTTLFSICKVVTSTTTQSKLLARLVGESVAAANADMGWIQLHDDVQESLLLKAQHGFPSAVLGRMHQAWADGLSLRVFQSGGPQGLLGDELNELELGHYAQAALASPINVQGEMAGILGVARKEPRPFEERDQIMLATVADFASISLVNARLFQALTSRAQKLDKVLDDRKRGAYVQAAWIEGVNERLAIIRKQLALVAHASNEAKTRAGLKGISEKLKDLLQELADLPGGQHPEPEESTPETPSPWPSRR
jgi:DNA-binding response OmpR family regulator